MFQPRVIGVVVLAGILLDRRTAPDRAERARIRWSPSHLIISENCVAELVLRIRAPSNTCGRMQRLKEPVRAHRPEDVEVERENRECNRQIH